MFIEDLRLIHVTLSVINNAVFFLGCFFKFLPLCLFLSFWFSFFFISLYYCLTTVVSSTKIPEWTNKASGRGTKPSWMQKSWKSDVNWPRSLHEVMDILIVDAINKIYWTTMGGVNYTMAHTTARTTYSATHPRGFVSSLMIDVLCKVVR